MVPGSGFLCSQARGRAATTLRDGASSGKPPDRGRGEGAPHPEGQGRPGGGASSEKKPEAKQLVAGKEGARGGRVLQRGGSTCRGSRASVGAAEKVLEDMWGGSERVFPGPRGSGILTPGRRGRSPRDLKRTAVLWENASARVLGRDPGQGRRTKPRDRVGAAPTQGGARSPGRTLGPEGRAAPAVRAPGGDMWSDLRPPPASKSEPRRFSSPRTPGGPHARHPRPHRTGLGSGVGGAL